MEKTHWLQSPNKNYLGHWDLPESGEMTLTIDSAKWEAVKNPITNKEDSKRVIRWAGSETKPMICNQTNAQSILKSTGVKFMEDSGGTVITLYIARIVDKRSKEEIDCIRVRSEPASITLPELTLDHKRWKEAKKAWGDGNFEGVQKQFIVSPAMIKLLNS